MTDESKPGDSGRELLRHTVATLAYRGGKTLRGAAADFGEFRIREGTRSPGELVAHIGDLLDWGLAMAKGEKRWHNSPALPWAEGADRFFAALAAFDAYLASDSPLHVSAEKLFQGPIADALTHVGQIAMLRRLAGSPLRGENYYAAEITVGRVSADQPLPRVEFD